MIDNYVLGKTIVRTDEQTRFPLPAEARNKLEISEKVGVFYIEQGLGFAHILPYENFKKEIQKASTLPREDPTRLAIAGNSYEFELDKQSRLFLPTYLRNKLNIEPKSDLLLISNLDCITIPNQLKFK